jgi:hypothetical protein
MGIFDWLAEVVLKAAEEVRRRVHHVAGVVEEMVVARREVMALTPLNDGRGILTMLRCEVFVPGPGERRIGRGR